MIAFPIPLAQFWRLLPIEEMVLSLPGTAQTARTRGGELLPSEYGTRLWEGEVQLAALTAAEQRAVTPLLHLLQGAGAAFFIEDNGRLPGPALDPLGAGLGGASVTLQAVPAGREVSLSGLPPGYQLSAGDRLSFRSGAHLAFHELTQGGKALSTGNLLGLEVTPPPRPGASAGTAVTLVRPQLAAVLVPGSCQPPRRRSGAALYTGGSFAWRQSLRII